MCVAPLIFRGGIEVLCQRHIFCRYNAEHPDGQNKSLLYHEFPQHYTWQPRAKQWQPRQMGGAVGRMYYTGPSESSPPLKSCDLWQ